MRIEVDRGRGLSNDDSGTECFASKLLREVDIIRAGIGGITDAAQAAIIDRPLGTASSVALSIGMGFLIARFAPACGLRGFLARTGGAAMGVCFAGDLLINGKEICRALASNWESSLNLNANRLIMRKHLGQFAFDTCLMTAGGMVGVRVGQSVFGRKVGDLPLFTMKGYLPPGEHRATWNEFSTRFGTSPERLKLIEGLKTAVLELGSAGVGEVYLGGSFVTRKGRPADFDGGWNSRHADFRALELNDSVLLKSSEVQRQALGGHLFKDTVGRPPYGYIQVPVSEFFRMNTRTRSEVGLVVLDLANSPELGILRIKDRRAN